MDATITSNNPTELIARFQSAWNSHDMDAFGGLFHADASFVNRFATYWRGREAIVAGHRHIHETIYRDSSLENELLALDRIGEDVAILHYWTRLTTGAAHPAGPHQVDTLIMAVATRIDGSWRIQAAENVTLADPMSGASVLRQR